MRRFPPSLLLLLLGSFAVLLSVGDAAKTDTKYFVELLVVADVSIKERFSSNAEALKFLKTLVTQTDAVYKHKSLDPLKISIEVLKIYWSSSSLVKSFTKLNDDGILEDTVTLSKFCYWMSMNRWNRSVPNYDHAIFILGQNYGSKTAGVTFHEGMCRVGQDCSLIIARKRRLFRIAFTTAHELAHSMGVEHTDESEHLGLAGECRRTQRHKPKLAVMHRQLRTFWPDQYVWSKCSRMQLQENIPRIMCLKNKPTMTRYKLKPPIGQYWSARRQCQLVFGSSYKPNYVHKSLLCRRLCCYDSTRWFQRSLRCQSRTGFPEGTPCGDNKWCRRGTCISQFRNGTSSSSSTSAPSHSRHTQQHSPGDEPEPRWFISAVWSACSVTCGAGVRARKLVCGRRHRYKVRQLPLYRCARAPPPETVPTVPCVRRACDS